MEAIIDNLHNHHQQQQEFSSGQSSFSSSIQDQDHDQTCQDVVIDYDLLLEESWFFGNLLINQKPKMLRCFSDPCPSSSSSISNIITLDNNNNNNTITRNLARAPSLPPNIGREEKEEEEEEENGNSNRVLVTKLASDEKKERKSSKIIKEQCCYSLPKPKKNMLVRTQTLPTSMRKVEIVQDHHGEDKINGGISKSNRQPSLNLADILPPRHNKGNSSRNRTPKNTILEGFYNNTDGSREMRRRYQNGKNMRRSLSDLEIEEVQGFKDLGFTFDKLKNPSVVNIIPGLQEKNEEDSMGLENKVRRPYLSEAWLAQSYSPPPPPPPPSWAFRKSSGEDMKAHIKFWARAVASNVRQEC
ncbi:hypothetical protein CsatB_000200 [Cannabis sativa]